MKSLFVSILILGLVGMVVAVAVKAVNINVTVTPGEISVALSRSTTSYGVMLLSTSKDDPAGAIVATAGNAEIDLNFTGANAIYSGYTWTLAATPGADIYRHSVTINSTETSLTTPDSQKLVSDLPASATEDFTLKMYTPSSTTGPYGNPYSTTVTVTAVSSL